MAEETEDFSIIIEEEEGQIKELTSNFELKEQTPKQKETRRTIVLDLDETLVHSSYIPPEKYDFSKVIFYENISAPVYVLKRPGLDEFLRECHRLKYEIAIFTASTRDYANPVIDELNKEEQLISRRFYRDDCVIEEENGNLIKDLSIVNSNLAQVFMIDNNPQSCSRQPRNVLPISTWINDPNDRALISFIPLLKKIATEENFFKVIEDYQKRAEILYLSNSVLIAQQYLNLYRIKMATKNFTNEYHDGEKIDDNGTYIVNSKKRKHSYELICDSNSDNIEGKKELDLVEWEDNEIVKGNELDTLKREKTTMME